MVYSQLLFINEGSEEVLMILVQDFYLLNLSKTLGELGQRIEMHLHLLAKFTKCFRQVQQEKVLCWTLIDKYKLSIFILSEILVSP